MVTNLESICRDVFKDIFPNDSVFYNQRPEWLKHPITGNPLELDIYFPEKKLAFEINGPLHETRLQRFVDHKKYKQCKQKGVRLISINSFYDLLHTVLPMFDATLVLQKTFQKIADYKPSENYSKHLGKIASRHRKIERSFKHQPSMGKLYRRIHSPVSKTKYSPSKLKVYFVEPGAT